MKNRLLIAVAILATASCTGGKTPVNTITPPAYPLVTIDPYTSAWSMTDKLYDESVKHWTGRDFPLVGTVTVDGHAYRFLGKPSVEYDYLAPISKAGAWPASYTFNKPTGDWTSPSYRETGWKKGEGGFGMPLGGIVKTLWEGRDVWVRRSFDIDNLDDRQLYLLFTNDDGMQLFLNGEPLFDAGVHCNTDRVVALGPECLAALRPGRNVIAAHCENTGGPAALDFGIAQERPLPEGAPETAIQNRANVLPTRTIYDFTCGPVDLELTFMAPLLLDRLELVSRPVNYISYEIVSNDGAAHEVSISLEASPRWALNFPEQESRSETVEHGDFVFVKSGSAEQDILGKDGDDVRIDWGYFYMGGEKATTTASADGGSLILERSIGKVRKSNGNFYLGYDDIRSIQYFGNDLRPYWNRLGNRTILDEFEAAATEYPHLARECAAFDRVLMEKAEKAGGEKYASLLALAYRQSVSAHKLVESPEGELLFLSKENNSNGCIGTVDITYPSAPLFLIYNPELVKGMMNPIFYFSESGRWTKPFAAHDVGTYPLANGQRYGGDMPVEENGNMLILTAAVCRYSNSWEYARKHWDVLTTWADYLLQFGLDPENQLCTDDFAGHFAHNANLSIKAILGIASYGLMARNLGMEDVAEEYCSKAGSMAAEWVNMAEDGDHYRLTFDKAGTWSQKYNLVWDKLLNLNIFPKEVASREIAWYLTRQNTWGLPLDSRKSYTKTDWVLWTATLAETAQDFEALVAPVWKYYDETTDRVPMSDWVYTDNLDHVGFKARSVVGGLFIKLLDE